MAKAKGNKSSIFLKYIFFIFKIYILKLGLCSVSWLGRGAVFT